MRTHANIGEAVLVAGASAGRGTLPAGPGRLVAGPRGAVLIPNAALAVLNGTTQARIIAAGADEGGALLVPPAPGVPRLGDAADLLRGQAEAGVALAILIALLAIGAAVTRVRFARVGGREGHRRPTGRSDHQEHREAREALSCGGHAHGGQ